ILPWNYPFYLINRKMAPALITGNAIVIKSAPDTPGIAYEFAKIAAQSRLPKGLLNIISGGDETGEALAGHPGVGMITLTGSVRAGTGVMTSAAPNITKVSLELGGKAPVIVMADADLDEAIEDIYQSRIVNSGQVCSCAERVYVQKSISKKFISRMVARMEATRWGDPSKIDELDMGPIISLKQITNIQAMVDKAVEQGAKILTGGKRVPDRKGYYFEPTVLTGSQEMEIFHKEIFGPVLPITTFETFDEAVAMANDCEYGLTSSVFTKNVDIMMRACQELQFGETYINRMHGETVQGFHSGWKKSGIGGSDGKYGLEEYVQPRLVYVKYDSAKK
ncbi:MAG: aldehyde dehydrogenase, partial [Clostridia bacterium]|nr:aldehyde dehydrogenase [Clostridia bacterium]